MLSSRSYLLHLDPIPHPKQIKNYPPNYMPFTAFTVNWKQRQQNTSKFLKLLYYEFHFIPANVLFLTFSSRLCPSVRLPENAHLFVTDFAGKQKYMS